ncbi:MAG: PSD1 domain-containing protein [Bryobacterales bacterium]|nr:PSD1 domain-containing protein [Bryobacterales bacterium]
MLRTRAVFFLAGVCLAAPPVDFTKDVQPIFAERCYSCHGPKAQLGGLRLDSKDIAAKSIHPGKSGTSSLFIRVAGIGDQARMPMGGKPLSPAEIDIIKQWIDEGAPWPDQASAQGATVQKHWAFIAPGRPSAPKTNTADWIRNPIDAFVLARLDKEGLEPSPEADRITLLRRLSLDLIGLPPTLAEVDEFLSDTSRNAYEKQVERLLSSPHYGERWGRHWLDAARYADSDGFEKDKQRSVWFYRDWVVSAHNRDLPYSQFLTEQLAGDLMPNPTQDQLVATGFLRNSMINEEGGVDPEQFRMEAMFDRMDAIGKAMLGITIQCAQCHNHKYDPLTQEEYYKLFAYLNNSNEGSVAVYTPAEQIIRSDIFRNIREIEQDLQHRTPDWAARMAKWEAAVRNEPNWSVLRPEVDDISTGGQKYIPLSDGSFLAQGYAPTKHRVKFTTKIDTVGITGFRLELLNDPNLPLNGPGRSLKGTGALTEFEAEIAPASDPKKVTKVKFTRATADINLPERELDAMFYDKTDKRRVTGPIEYAIDGKDETAWGIDAGPGRRNQPRKAVFQPSEPIGFEGGAILTIYLSQKAGGWNSDDNQSHNLGRMRLSVTTAPNPVADPLPATVRQILSVPGGERSTAQTNSLFSYWRTTVPEWSVESARIEELWRRHPEGSSQLVLQEREKEARQTHMLTRGDFLKPNKQVTAGVPAFLNPLPPDAPPTRLTLARWLTDRNAPTTARAFVNRVWQNYFGTGLIATSEDLGKQCDPPSHPELLDWLAVEFMEPTVNAKAEPWSMKQLHRLIVTSATYRQSSKVTPNLLEKDPFNRLLARGPRIRVEGEVVRDIALAASGLLNAKVGGPSVYPPAPDFLFQPPASYGPKVWKEEKGADRYRRALYTFRYRSVPYPMLQNFDTPNGDFACVRRPRSNTPLQALTTLNEPLFQEAARALAQKALSEGGSTNAEKLTYAFRRCLSRKPTDAETAELLGFLDRQQRRLSPADAWAATARVLLNLDETITKE